MNMKACLTEAWPLGEKLALWSVTEENGALANLGIAWMSSILCYDQVNFKEPM